MQKMLILCSSQNLLKIVAAMKRDAAVNVKAIIDAFTKIMFRCFFASNAILA